MSRRVVCDGNTCRIVNDNVNNNGKDLVYPSLGWTVYGASWCNYCKNACHYFDVLSIPYVYYDVDELSSEAKQKLVILTGGNKTIPKIFYDDEFIGGFTELKNVFFSR